ncbi:MAG: hypothetical protein ACKVHE_09070 [Planctomycetales bacterium]|jgi:hypothetical protein
MKSIRTSPNYLHIERACRRRRGTILVVFMISLAMLSLTTVAMVRVALLQRGVVRSNELRVQSEWLFQSAVARAASQLQANAEYNGEEWEIAADSIGQSFDAVARISVEPSDDQTKDRAVAITVIYPPDDPNRAMVSRTVSISP